uniref:Transcription repressor n=1 Tax=Kalanchoe fedtschenkoi TaxID=63787 RepID=A0A7N1A882_KALFE
KSSPKDHPSVSSSTCHSCGEQPKTLSFRVTPVPDCKSTTELSSTFSNSVDSRSLSTLTQDSGDEAEVLESVIRGVRSSERLFFSPEKSNSILEKTTDNKRSTDGCGPIMINLESRDPYMDFRTSMEEMVEAHGLQDWELLEELLGCYLMVNEKRNHSYIIRAFTDLLVSFSFIGLSSSGCCSPSIVSDSFVTSSSSPLHFSSSSTTAATSCSSSLAPADAVHDRGRGDCHVDKVSRS